MFSTSHRPPRRGERTGRGFNPVGVLAAAGAALLLGAVAIVPFPPEAVAIDGPLRTGGEQSLALADGIRPVAETRDEYGSDVSPERQKQALAADHTNYAWARLVLWYGGWPITDDSVTTIVRWMRQENGVDSWWLRNNPLNNGWGVGSYLNSVESLDRAAYYAADAIHTLGGYAGIRDALSSGTRSPDEIAGAIWASSWASGHYDYGGHWSTAPVPSVEAPADAWGI